ncbi:MAG: hypothetical protein QF473_08480 [Planctomycetota bacterium]|nr:hypothetical protein [Planctomycetota bacterium]
MRALISSMEKLYYGESRSRPDVFISEKTFTKVSDAVDRYADGGTDFHKLAGLALLARSPERAHRLAEAIREDTGNSPQLRWDALRVLLACAPSAEARKFAIKTLKVDDQQDVATAVRFLVNGVSGIRLLRKKIRLNLSSYPSDPTVKQVGKMIVPEPPPGLQVGDVQHLLKHTDVEVAALAGYLAAIMGDAAGLAPLRRHWEVDKVKYGVDTLMYRAIAVINDPRWIPVLEEIYEQYDHDDYEIRDMYWTIRIMTGPVILKLRKRIRTEVGAERLR